MKLIITILTMIFISFGANAFDVEDLYKRCKPYQNNAFNLEGLNIDQQQKALMCISYLRAVIDMGGQNCTLYRMIYRKTSDKHAIRTLSSFNANNPDLSLNAVITSFVIFSENNTQYWSYSPASYVKEVIGKNYPCKLDN